MSIQIIRSGLLTTIQDLGRYGFQKYGVIVSGAMDSFAFRIANLLVGNEENEAALEMTMIGPVLHFEQETVIAICGGNFSPTIDGHEVPLWRPVLVKKGGILRVGTGNQGCRAYLAVLGGFDTPKVMGSRSTYLRAGIGGYLGRALKDGDQLHFGTPSELSDMLLKKLEAQIKALPFAFANWTISNEIRPGNKKNPVIRVLRGQHFERFTKESRERFFTTSYQVTPQSDRMGYRLAGPALEVTESLELISEAVSTGTIQVPPDGKPIILLADRQTTGGYPKIAQIISVDLPIIAQVKPGENITFQEISLQEAEWLYVLREQEIGQLKKGIQLNVK